MTEAEWLGGADPTPLLEFLGGRASARKLRLFAVACCRTAWQRLDQPAHVEQRNWKALEAAEAFADGRATPGQLARVASQATGVARQAAAADLDPRAADALATAAAVAVARQAHARVAASDVRPEEVGPDHPLARELQVSPNALGDPRSAYLETQARERAAQAALLRDLLGNPFQPVTVGPAWLTSAVNDLATAAYKERTLPS